MGHSGWGVEVVRANILGMIQGQIRNVSERKIQIEIPRVSITNANHLVPEDLAWKEIDRSLLT